jgi:signal transduction histidine kinase
MDSVGLRALVGDVLAEFADEAADDPDNYLLACAAVLPAPMASADVEGVSEPLPVETRARLGRLAAEHFAARVLPGEDLKFATAAARLLKEHLISDVDRAHESRIRCYCTPIHFGVGELDRVVAFVLVTRPPSGGLLPLGLRRLAMDLKFRICEHLGILSVEEKAQQGFASRNPELALSAVADMTNAQGAILWRYDFSDAEFLSIASFGPAAGDYIVPRGGVRSDDRVVGVVGQVGFENELVVYDLHDAAARIPELTGWEPHDPEIFTRNNWTACAGWPVLSDGELIGALMVYAPALEELRLEKHIIERTTWAVREYLRDAVSHERMMAIERAYQQQWERNASGAVASEFIHDFKSGIQRLTDMMRVVQPALRGRPQAEQNMLEDANKALVFLKRLTSSLDLLVRGENRAERCDVSAVLAEYQPFLLDVVRKDNPAVRLAVEMPEASRDASLVVPMGEVDLLRVLINLLRNAAVWTRKVQDAKVTVRVQGPRQSAQGERAAAMVDIDVVDNGQGIDEADLGLVFSRGFTRRRESGGTGLGLHIVRQVVLRSGGRVRVWSRPRVATTFRVSLPNTGRVPQ